MNNTTVSLSSQPQPKKLMLLGGIRYLLPVISEAHKLGIHVLTADYLPDNIAHRYSDEYVNVSILDRDAVLAIAREKHIDGILSFGVDPGVVTAAYVAEKLGLPFPPLASVEILQNKDRFRDFLSTHGFNCPFHFSYTSKEEALSDPRLHQKLFVEKIPVIVKPVDSAGSKGCSRVDPNEFPQPSTLNSQPPPLNSQPSTLNPQPVTQPSTLNPQPVTQPSTLSPSEGFDESSRVPNAQATPTQSEGGDCEDTRAKNSSESSRVPNAQATTTQSEGGECEDARAKGCGEYSVTHQEGATVMPCTGTHLQPQTLHEPRDPEEGHLRMSPRSDLCPEEGHLHRSPRSALCSALDYAFSESHSGRIIVEQFLEKVGLSSDTDSFSINNELVFCSFNCQHFDPSAINPYTPSGYSWPSDMPPAAQAELRSEIQRLIRLLNLGTHVYNIETRYCTDGKPYIMELSPRGGGNRLSEILTMATSQDLIRGTILGALGMLPPPSTLNSQPSTAPTPTPTAYTSPSTSSTPLHGSTLNLNLQPQPKTLPHTDPSYNGSWAEVIIHANRSGIFKGIKIQPSTLNPQLSTHNVIQTDLWVSPGDPVEEFTGANKTIGTLVLRFDTHAEAEHALNTVNDWLKVDVL